MSSYLSTHHKMKRLDITSDDSKVLGKSPIRFHRRSADNFTTKKYQTYASAWTPVIHKPSNDQIFKERRELISHWFDLWTDSQRKRFLDIIFKKCGRSQLSFAHGWFEARAIIERVDPITVLPRFLFLYILSYLDAKTLSRASQASWTWKYSADQDCLWQPKCEKFGWYLPYKPSDTEYGCWKKHYIQCVLNLDVVLPTDFMYRTLTEAQKIAERQERMELLDDQGFQIKPRPISSEAANEILRSRPPWYGPSKSVTDLADANKAILYGFNPNEPDMSDEQHLFHNKFGQLQGHARAATAPGRGVVGRGTVHVGLSSTSRRNHNRTLSAGSTPHSDNKLTLSKVSIRRYSKALEKSLTELKSRPWEPVVNRSRVNVKDSSSYHPANSWRHQVKVKNPRIVFISSRVPAAEMLHDAVLNQVYPIPYEYEGTTVENLIDRLDMVLNGQPASSIGLVVHSSQPGEVCLLRDLTVTLDRLDLDKAVWFFERLAGHLKTSKEGGRIDIFSPVAASEPGVEILIQLQLLTGVQVSAPTGISGHNNRWNCEWYGLNSAPLDDYFESSKVSVWVAASDTVAEAVERTREQLQPYFDQTRKDLLNQLTGQMMADALALGNIHNLTRVAPAISNALAELGNLKDSSVDAIQFVAEHLSQSAGVSTSTSLQPGIGLRKYDGAGDEGDEKRDSLKEEKRAAQMLNDSQSDTFLTSGKMATQSQGLSQNTLSTMRRNGAFSMSLSTQSRTQYADHPDRRFVVAKEILSTETVYCQDLSAVRKIFVLPLKRSIESNRAIIASSTMQQLFSDITILEEINSELLSDLKPRIRQWSLDTCLGELFIKFASKLSAYMNFLSRYPTILLSLDNEVETNPGFRAFLKRQECTPSTRMKGLHELYMTPIERIADYVRLLSWLRVNTPKDNPDRDDLSRALQQIKEVDRIVRQTRSRIRRDRRLMLLQKQIVGCPKLIEANRVFVTSGIFGLMVIKNQQAANLPHENRLYVHVEDVGLFLFSDALVMTHVTTEHHAFERSIAHTHMFRQSIALTALSVRDVSDTRYIQNALKLRSGSEEWILTSPDSDAKFDFISTLQTSIKSAVKDFDEP